MFVGLVGATTGGATWERSNSTLYPGPGTSTLDLGPAHQGPLLLNQGRDGEDGWALYFSEFAVGAEYTARTGCGRERAVLHLAAVDTDAEGWPVIEAPWLVHCGHGASLTSGEPLPRTDCFAGAASSPRSGGAAFHCTVEHRAPRGHGDRE